MFKKCEAVRVQPHPKYEELERGMDFQLGRVETEGERKEQVLAER